ncbi:MAG: endonuclease domain-containing protein [Methyloligella sp. ZOD6]
MPHSKVSQFQLGNARRLRNSMSEAERRLWYRLRAHRLHGASFRRQAPIGRYVVDFVCHSAKLIIELDGGQHSKSALAVADKQRTEWLRSRGYKVLRFWNNEVLRQTDEVLTLIAVELSNLPPSRSNGKRSTDLPRKGGGDGAEEVATR